MGAGGFANGGFLQSDRTGWRGRVDDGEESVGGSALSNEAAVRICSAWSAGIQAAAGRRGDGSLHPARRIWSTGLSQRQATACRRLRMAECSIHVQSKGVGGGDVGSAVVGRRWCQRGSQSSRVRGRGDFGIKAARTECDIECIRPKQPFSLQDSLVRRTPGGPLQI